MGIQNYRSKKCIPQCTPSWILYPPEASVYANDLAMAMIPAGRRLCLWQRLGGKGGLGGKKCEQRITTRLPHQRQNNIKAGAVSSIRWYKQQRPRRRKQGMRDGCVQRPKRYQSPNSRKKFCLTMHQKFPM